MITSFIVDQHKSIKIEQHTTAEGIYILSKDGDVTLGSNCMFSRDNSITIFAGQGRNIKERT